VPIVKALVLFHSQEHGNTAAMAGAVAEGLRAAGAEVTVHNTNDSRFDIVEFPSYDCAAFGTPDYYGYVAGGVKLFLDDWHIANGRGVEGLGGKPYALFVSHGGGGKVRDCLDGLFRRVGRQVGELVESKGRPSGEVLARCRELGAALARGVPTP
jgi:multimeric flavodoxin WrbA